jgi:hypothetical protein
VWLTVIVAAGHFCRPQCLPLSFLIGEEGSKRRSWPTVHSCTRGWPAATIGGGGAGLKVVGVGAAPEGDCHTRF